jgi:hypothetical protein
MPSPGGGNTGAHLAFRENTELLADPELAESFDLGQIGKPCQERVPPSAPTKLRPHNVLQDALRQNFGKLPFPPSAYSGSTPTGRRSVFEVGIRRKRTEWEEARDAVRFPLQTDHVYWGDVRRRSYGSLDSGGSQS